MNNKILTFSIAAYNVERFIDKCIDSMLSSGCKEDIEILVVDDGSSDKTAEIAGGYEKKYPGTVRLISKENGGHGSTINTGIKEAKGKYFRAVDGDDWINTCDMVKLIENLRDEESDVVLCNYLHFFEDGKIKQDKYAKAIDGRLYKIEEINKILDWMNYHSVIYRTDILRDNNIRLDENCFYVDTEFMAFSVPFINTVRYYDLDIYCYRRDNEGQSVCELSRIKNIDQSKKVAIHLLRFLKKHEEDMSCEKLRYLQGGVAGHCMWHFRGLTFFAPDEKKRRELIIFERYIKKMSPEVFGLMTVPASNRAEGDAGIIRHIRKYNYKTFNLYGIYRRGKGKLKELIHIINKH